MPKDQVTITGADINAVLQVAKSLSSHGEVQLGTMAHALAIACKSTGVDREVAIERFTEAFDTEHTLIPWGKGSN